MREKNKTASKESGELMLEAMIVVTITIFVLIWLLSLGFLYYERYLTTIITNDAAVKVAATYNNPTADIIMGYVASDDLYGRDLYRSYASDTSESDLRATNQYRANGYVQYALDRSNFVGVIKDVQVEMALVPDSTIRKHVQVTTTCTYNTPLGGIFEMFGGEDTHTFSVTSCAECTDYSEYFSAVGFNAYLLNGSLLGGTGLADSVLKAINSFVKVYNHFHD